MKPLTAAELEALKALVAAATEEPWTADRNRLYRGDANTLPSPLAIGVCHTEDTSFETAQANAAFIAASREAVPRLIADLERMRVLLGIAAEWKRYQELEAQGTADTALLEACRGALQGVLFYVDEMAERVLGQPKELLPDKRLATARAAIKQLDKRRGANTPLTPS